MEKGQRKFKPETKILPKGDKEQGSGGGGGGCGVCSRFKVAVSFLRS